MTREELYARADELRREAKARRAARPRRCTRCKTTDLPKGRLSWCSDACVRAHQVENWPAYRRPFVFMRDGGICRLCGAEPLPGSRAAARWHALVERSSLTDGGAALVQRIARALVSGTYGGRRAPLWLEFAQGMERSFIPRAPNRRVGYEIDHIVPASLGGLNDLSNLRLLCRRCHVAETGRLAREKAAFVALPDGARVGLAG